MSTYKDQNMQSIEWYFLIGGIAGTMAGLLGVGGGIIVVPALIMVFGV